STPTGGTSRRSPLSAETSVPAKAATTPPPARAARLMRLVAQLLILLAPAPFSAAAPPSSSHGASGDEVMARVDGRPILRKDHDLAVQLQFQGRRTGSVSLEELRAVRQQVLESLIDSALLLEKAAKTGVTVTDAEVDEELERLRKSFETQE